MLDDVTTRMNTGVSSCHRSFWLVHVGVNPWSAPLEWHTEMGDGARRSPTRTKQASMTGAGCSELEVPSQVTEHPLLLLSCKYSILLFVLNGSHLALFIAVSLPRPSLRSLAEWEPQPCPARPPEEA
jgi:hypothetical protein